MVVCSRRGFLQASRALVAGAAAGLASGHLVAGESSGSIAEQAPSRDVTVLNPRNRVPLSFFIDDSTALVNLGHFGMPQLAEAWPERAAYKKPWKTWPREIPDAFLREFSEWCAEHGVRGKFSVIPYPACVGWVDRELPGWSRQELRASLKLIHESIVPHWDIHPEMISHTRVIDLKTGRPLEEISPATMENSYPQTKKSVDELAAYMAYALRILKNCEFVCEGITTPGGFGTLVKTELSLAVQQAVRDVYGAEIPHYFKYVSDGKESTQPKLEHVSGQDTDDLRLTVNVPAGTGDWFGNWDGDSPCEGFRYANDDATRGRMVELVERGEPAVMLCHWAGLYNQGTKRGFEDMKKVIQALHARFGQRTTWMKISELARYWAARQLTRIAADRERIMLQAPLACKQFTLRVGARAKSVPRLVGPPGPVSLRRVSEPAHLQSNTWCSDEQGLTICFELEKGSSMLHLETTAGG